MPRPESLDTATTPCSRCGGDGEVRTLVFFSRQYNSWRMLRCPTCAGAGILSPAPRAAGEEDKRDRS